MLREVAILESRLNNATDLSSRLEDRDLMPKFSKSIGCAESGDASTQDGYFFADDFIC